ncbi:MAG: hypothetical protein HYR60_08945 [Acidobacteria bacterium]|nr:hypothetical protein [Acidobacteriota bacterium]
MRYGFHRWWPFQRYLCWMTLTFFGFAWIVVWFYSYGIAVIPEARRYALEFELFLFLAVFEYFRLIVRSPNPSIRLCAYGPAGMMLLAGWSQPWRLATQGFADRTPLPREDTIEYRLARRLADWQPRGRVYASGGLRFRLNSWFDFPQVGGGFESGLSDRMTFALAFQIRTGVNSEPGQEARDALEELKVLGVEYLVIHGPQSREHYRDFKNPRLIEGLLDVAYREEDDTIYRVPFQSLAHLVERDELVVWPPSSRLPAMARYVAAIEDPLRPKLAATWLDSSRLRIEGPVPAGKLISVQVRNDPGWAASQDGRPVAIETDRVGYCVLRPEPSPRARIDLRYGGTREQKVMGILSAVVWIGALAGLAVKRGAR